MIFTSILKENTVGYCEMADKMEDLAKQQDGFLGIDSARQNVGITISYWTSLEAIKKWKQHREHTIAQLKGKQDWYDWYNVRICKIEREYDFNS